MLITLGEYSDHLNASRTTELWSFIAHAVCNRCAILFLPLRTDYKVEVAWCHSFTMFVFQALESSFLLPI